MQAMLKNTYDLDIDRSDIIACIAKTVYDEQEDNEPQMENMESVFLTLGVATLSLLLEKNPDTVENLIDMEKEAEIALSNIDAR